MRNNQLTAPRLMAGRRDQGGNCRWERGHPADDGGCEMALVALGRPCQS